MSSKRRNSNRSRARRKDERRLIIRGIRRDPPDLRKISKAVIGLAMAEAEREAQAQQAIRNVDPGVAADGDQASGERDE